MKKIAVIGAGYVGLVTGACFAQKDNIVFVVENNKEKINALLAGKIPFYEPGLDELVAQGIANKKLVFVNQITQALAELPDIIFSCVGTPSLTDGSADLSYVWQVAAEIGKSINRYCLMVNKSTVPVGTAQKVKTIIQEHLNARNLTIEFDVASNPEFLKEGDALNDFFHPDRVVIGVESKKAKLLLADLYKPFLTNDDQLIVMNLASAELTKYASNSMLATRISFMNQMALLADKVGADIHDVRRGIAHDKRIGPHFLNAGIGFGGSCFPKDVKALIHMGIEYQQPMTLIREVDRVNDLQRIWFIEQILNFYSSSIKGKKAGIWGLAFKPETDDIRCAPSIDIINALLNKGATINAYDPIATENMKKLFKTNVHFASSREKVLQQSDFLLILTEWSEFKNAPLEKFTLLGDKLIFDGRNCFNPATMRALGLTYFTVGRNSVGNLNQLDQTLQCFDRLSSKHFD